MSFSVVFSCGALYLEAPLNREFLTRFVDAMRNREREPVFIPLVCKKVKLVHKKVNFVYLVT